MARIRIELPVHFGFSTNIPIRITDLNYGSHVGNDSVLSIIHEARMQFLNHIGLHELDIGGIGLIMSDVAIEFKSELFYGDQVVAYVTAGEFSKVAFNLFYKIEKQTDSKKISAVIAKTGMIGYDYNSKKIAAIPDEARVKLQLIG